MYATDGALHGRVRYDIEGSAREIRRRAAAVQSTPCMQQKVMARAPASQDFAHKSADEFDAESSKVTTTLIDHECLSLHSG
jgi:hypothetical protein